MEPNIFKPFGFGVLLQGVHVIILLITTAFLTSSLGVEVFGQYVLIITFVSLLGAITVFGLPTFLTRNISASLSTESSRKEFASPSQSVMYSLATSSVLVAMVSIVFLMFWDSWAPLTSELVTFIVIAILLGKSFLEIMSGALAGMGFIRKSQTVTFLFLHGPFLLLLLAAHAITESDLTIVHILGIQLIGIWLGLSVAGIWTWKELSRNPGNWQHPAFWGPCILECIPLTMVNGIASIKQNVVFLVVGYYLTPSDVGIYRIAERVGSAALFFRAAIEKILQPEISRRWQRGALASYSDRLRKVTEINMVFNIAIFLLFIVSGDVILRTAFGDQSLAALTPILILFAGHFVNTAFGFNGMVLSMTNHARKLASIISFTVTVLIVLLVVFTQIFGVAGAAIATAMYLAITGALLWMAARRIAHLDISVFHLFRRSRI
jgi:O-antigen/teichoic acid export membrane protein